MILSVRFRRLRERPDEVEKMVFWKTRTQEDGVDYGPVWIVDANDPNRTLETFEKWVTWEEAEQIASERGLPIEDV